MDAHLNPARKVKLSDDQNKMKKLYLGLYDLFIYGSIVFLLFGIFKYFIAFVMTISIIAIPVQIYRLKRVSNRK